MNKYLHQLCKLAKIDTLIKSTHYEGNKRIDDVQPKYELVGTHCGRRTFICMAARRLRAQPYRKRMLPTMESMRFVSIVIKRFVP